MSNLNDGIKPCLHYYNISPKVAAFSTTRHGGFSHGLYGQFNINRYCGDDDACVDKNLEILSKELNIDKNNIIMPHQTHGTEARLIAEDFLSLPFSTRSMVLEGVDTVMTNVRNVCIGVSTADCIPIILYDNAHHACAAVHAGWRGTVRKIVEKTVETMRIAYDSHLESLFAVIGPGISLDAFEVGDEVYEEFASSGFNMPDISNRQGGKWHIDLPGCNLKQLINLGWPEKNITATGVCTYNNTDEYFSARRLGTLSGRIYTGILLK